MRVVVPEDYLQNAADVLLAHDGVDAVSVVASGFSKRHGAGDVRRDLRARTPGSPAPEPTIVGGDVMLEGTLHRRLGFGRSRGGRQGDPE